MAEEKKDNKNNEKIDMLKNFIQFQKLQGDALKQKVSLDPFLKGSESALKKAGASAAEESITKLGLEDTSKQFLEMASRGVGGPRTGGAAQSPQQPQQQPQNNILQDIGKFLFQPGGVNKSGAVEPAGLLGGLIQESSASVLQRQQAQALAPSTKSAELQAKQDFELKKVKFTQDRLDQREKLKNDLKGAGEVDENIIKRQTFALDLQNFMQSFDKLIPQGGNKLRSGGLAIARAGGQKREEFANFEANAEILSFSLGDALLGQTGRAFTEPERLEVKKRIIAASTNSTRGQFFGKMDAIINSVNNRIKTSGGKILLPKARELLGQIKSGGIQQTLPGVQSEIDAINSRLDQLGGR